MQFKENQVKEESTILEKEKIAEEFTFKEKDNKKIKTIVTVVISVFAIIIAFIIVLTTLIIPNAQYTDAITLMDEGKYTEAASIFKDISGYKDSDQKENQALYLHATNLQKDNNYEAAIEIFELIKNYKDSISKVVECEKAMMENKYIKAVSFLKEKDYKKALEIFEDLKEFKDSKSKAIACMNALAEQCAAKDDIDGAIRWYTKCDDITAIKEAKYKYILKHRNNTDTKTYEYLKELKLEKYKDSDKIYTDLYTSISVDLFFNTDFSDKSTRITTLKINKGYVSTNAYYHYKINGGYPGQIFKLKIVEEERVIDDYYDIGWYSFEKGEEVKASDGVQSFSMSPHIGNYYRITIYDRETGKKLASKTLTVPNNY